MYKNDCGSYFVIEYNGDVFPCDFFVTKEWFLGNILENSIDELLMHPKHIEFTRLRSLERAECKTCRWLGFCERGCIKFRYCPEMDYTSLNYLCTAYNTFFDYAYSQE